MFNYMSIKILAVFDTRPKAIKIASFVNGLKDQQGINAKISVSAQHRERLEQARSQVTSNILLVLEPIPKELKPHLVLVHPSTSRPASLPPFYQQISMGYVEAGLRTNNLKSPWPEEDSRKLTSVITMLHFQPNNQLQNKNIFRQ